MVVVAAAVVVAVNSAFARPVQRLGQARDMRKYEKYVSSFSYCCYCINVYGLKLSDVKEWEGKVRLRWKTKLEMDEDGLARLVSSNEISLRSIMIFHPRNSIRTFTDIDIDPDPLGQEKVALQMILFNRVDQYESNRIGSYRIVTDQRLSNIRMFFWLFLKLINPILFLSGKPNISTRAKSLDFTLHDFIWYHK